MIKIIRTHSEHSDFIQLVNELDAYLKITDGAEHDFYNQYNNIDVLNHVVLAYDENEAVGCGAFKKYDSSNVEIKRMFTNPGYRQQGIASKILDALEAWANELGFNSCMLETGIRQYEAVDFYKKNNYKIIPNYGQYQGIENSLCFKKELNSL